MTWLFDTNVCVDLLKGHPQVSYRVEAVSPADCVVSAVTVFELAAGVRRCAQPERERKKIARLLAVITVLPFDLKAAEEAARIRHELEIGGQKIGPYDLLIAGQALSANCTLISNNTREFSRIPGLRLEDWRT